jgi:hypothetical protein
MCSGSPHGSVPPFACGQIGAVDLKFLPDRVPLGRRFQPTDVASMAKLGLRVAPDDVVVENPGHPVSLLLFGRLLAYRRDWRCQLCAHVTQEQYNY